MLTSLIRNVSFALLVTASVASARETEDCQKFYNNYIGPVVNARDSGVPPSMIFQQLTMVGIPPELANNIVGMVYVVHKDNDADFIEEDYMNWCSGKSL